MRFEWDPDKNDWTKRARGFDFAFATLVFRSRTLERDDTRRDYGGGNVESPP